MLCRLCLTIPNQSIFIFSEENIQLYIMKFLKLELTPQDPVSEQICAPCWQQIASFQNFCCKIEEAQKTLKAALEHPNLGGEETEYETLNAETSGVEPKDPESRSVKLKDPENSNFQLKDPESSLTPLKKEFAEDKSVDLHKQLSTLYSLEENSVKVELSNEDEPNILTPTTSNSPEKSDKPIPTQRVTRSSNLQKSEYKVTQTVKTRIKSNSNMKEEVEIEPEKTNTEELGEDIDTTNEITSPPKKDSKVKNERFSKIIQTAREFDAIIKKHMTLSCDLCFVKLANFMELKRHFRIIHKIKGYAICCNKKLFKRGLVVDHINVHNNPEYFKCPKCGKVLADRMCLRNHDLLLHQTEENLKFQCTYCPEKFAKQYLLDHHRIKHIRKDKSKLLCPQCGHGFLNESTLTNHLNKVHSTDYDQICEICAKIVRGKAQFRRHMREHEGIVQPRVQCTKCGMWLKTRRILVKHMEKHDGKTYTCNVCGKNSASKSALQSHMSYVHDALRKHVCPSCEKSFKKPQGLKEHMTTHTGEVLYTCPHCPKTFNSRANMHSHRKKKHREEWEHNRTRMQNEPTEK